MTVVVVTPPEPIVSLELAKQHLRAETDDDDTLIEAYIAAAQGSIDGPAGWLGRAVGVQTLELRLPYFPGAAWCAGRSWNWRSWPFSRIELPFPPLIDIVSVTYEDTAGVDQVLTSTGWKAGDDGVAPTFDTVWPRGRIEADAVRIRYRAGYVQDAAADPLVPAPPAPIVAAVLLITGGLYGAREDTVVDASRVAMIQNPTVEKLLAPYRVWRL